MQRRARFRVTLAAAVLAAALAAALGAGCGAPARLTMQVTMANTTSLGVTITNVGDGASGPLTLTLVGAGVFSIDSDACSGQTVAPSQHCFVLLRFPATTEDQPEGTLSVDDGHGRRAMIPLDVVKSFAQLVVESQFGASVDVREGTTADATVVIRNSGNARSGPIAVDFAAKLVADTCSGATVGTDYNSSCSFEVEYAAPIGQHEPVTLSGTVHADPGGSVPASVHFNVLGLLYAGGPTFGSAAPAGATSTVQIVDTAPTPVGPLQLSIENASSVPAVAYPPFILVAGQDQCSGQTLSSTGNSSCTLTVGLDPRLPAGGNFRATLQVRGGGESLGIFMEATRGTP